MDSQAEIWGEASHSEKGHLIQVVPEDREGAGRGVLG